MFEVVHKDPRSRARLGRLTTPHGVVETPAYVIVATNGAVRCLEPEDIPQTGTQIVIANTYHLWRDLGESGLSGYPGLHAAMDWQGPIMTDSGGFQVFSLGFLREFGMRRGSDAANAEGELAPSGMNQVRITESGVYFKTEEGGEEEYLDAEFSIRIQEQLGADIIVAFDEPTSPHHGYEYTKAALRRTHAWAERSLEAKQSKQALYGVVQGGAFEDLRRESAAIIGGMPFDGYAIGSTYGDAYGGTKGATRDMLDWSIPLLPQSKPRHLFGVGRIEDLFAGVEAGIDTFDCVIPTREARHQSLWTSQGRFNIGKGACADDSGPIASDCGCPVCADLRIERKELHRMFKIKNPSAGRLATIHNVYFFNDLMEQMRNALREGRFAEFRDEYLAKTEK